MFGRESLREFIRGENKSLREFLRGENKSLREFLQRENESFGEFLRGENESFREFLRGENESLRELVDNLHKETLSYQEKSKEEYQRLWEEMREFNREILLRNEKVYTAVIAEMEKNGKQVEENTERTRAGTQAILRLLDRFDERGGAVA